MAILLNLVKYVIPSAGQRGHVGPDGSRSSALLHDMLSHLQGSVGTWGLTGLDRLLCFMICYPVCRAAWVRGA